MPIKLSALKTIVGVTQDEMKYLSKGDELILMVDHCYAHFMKQEFAIFDSKPTQQSLEEIELPGIPDDYRFKKGTKFTVISIDRGRTLFVSTKDVPDIISDILQDNIHYNAADEVFNITPQALRWFELETKQKPLSSADKALLRTYFDAIHDFVQERKDDKQADLVKKELDEMYNRMLSRF